MEFTWDDYGIRWLTPGEFGLLGYGCRERHAAGLEDRPSGNEGVLILHFHDSVKIDLGEGLTDHPPETLLIYPPGRHHMFGLAERPWSHSWFWAYGTFLEREIAEAGLPTERPVRLAQSAPTERALTQFHEEMTGYAAPDLTILQCLLRIWLRELRRTIFARSHALPPPGLIAARRRIERDWDQPLTLATLAAEAGLSPPHFCAAFRRWFGVSPMAHQIDLRMQRASHLLRNRGLTVAQVAAQVGCQDVYHFSKLFKRRCGLTPGAMRRRFRHNDG